MEPAAFCLLGAALLVSWALLLPLASAADVIKGDIYTLTFLDSPVRGVHWVGPSDLLVFAYTQGGHLWRSQDGGVTWLDDTDAAKLQPPPENTTSSPLSRRTAPGVVGLAYSPLGAKKVFFRGDSEYHWRTEDGGNTYEAVHGPPGYMGVMPACFHPSEPDWFLVKVRRWVCYINDAVALRGCADDLFVTEDMGKTWRNLTMESQGRILGFVDFDWVWNAGEGAGGSGSGSGSGRSGVLASVLTNRPDVRRHIGKYGGISLNTEWSQHVDLVRSGDYFRSEHVTLMPCGYQLDVLGGKVFVAAAERCGKGPTPKTPTGDPISRLFVSSNRGASFAPACFPVALPERGFSLLPTGGGGAGGAFVNVDWELSRRGRPFGTLFAPLPPGGGGELFSVVLRRNTRSLTNVVDFSAVQGLPGVYIANQVDEGAEDVAAQGHRPASAEGAMDETVGEAPKPRSLITFNGGGRWEPLVPPAAGADGAPYDCHLADGCSLHLHGSTAWAGASGYAFVYSHASTPGTVMATGNVGRHLDHEGEGGMNTYLSRDGGTTWREAAKGARVYELGDSGGVVVTATRGPGPAAGGHVAYSLDEGLTWRDLGFPPNLMLSIADIHVEPDNVGRRFVLQGLAGEDHLRGALIGIDFQKGSQYRDCGLADYEAWSPPGGRCLLGGTVTLQRQVQAAQCWNTVSYRRPEASVSPCPCGPADSVCEFGAERVGGGNGSRCAPIEGFGHASAAATCSPVASGAYRLSPTSERRAAGDVCVDVSRPVLDAGRPRTGAGGGGGRWPRSLLWLGLAALLVGFFAAAAAAAAISLLASRGWLPDALADRLPLLEHLVRRPPWYWSIPGERRPGGGGGAAEEEGAEMYHRPPG